MELGVPGCLGPRTSGSLGLWGVWIEVGGLSMSGSLEQWVVYIGVSPDTWVPGHLGSRTPGSLGQRGMWVEVASPGRLGSRTPESLGSGALLRVLWGVHGAHWVHLVAIGENGVDLVGHWRT